MCGSETVSSITFNFAETDLLMPGYSLRTSVSVPVFIQTDKGTYDLKTAPCASDIELSCENQSVATIEKDDTTSSLIAKGVGTTICKAEIKGQNMSGTMTVHVLNPDNLKNNLVEKQSGKYIHIYQNPIQLSSPGRVTQGFDFYNDEFIYFSQMLYNGADAKTTDGKAYDRKGVSVIPFYFKTGKQGDYMTFQCSGHGQGISVESVDGKDYIWLGNYGSLNDNATNGFSQSQTISRVEWDLNKKSLYPWDITDHYTYISSGSYNHSFEPAVDAKNNHLAVRAYNTASEKMDDGKNHQPLYIRTYNLNDAKQLSQKSIKLPNPITTIDEKDKKITNYQPEIKIKDLAELTPIDEMKTHSGEFPTQGFDIDNGLLYAIGGGPTAIDKTLDSSDIKPGKYNYKSQIQINVYTYNGDLVGKYYLQTSKANDGYLVNTDFDDMVNEKDAGNFVNWNIGYFEPEGIRVREGKLFINMAVKLNYYKDKNTIATRTKHYIFVYDLTK